jgi:pyruvyl transferase EpsO
MTGEAFAEGMRMLAAKALATGDLIPEGAPVWLVDYPLYPNFGDVLILLGTLDVLRARSAQIVGATSLAAAAAAPRRVSERTVCVLEGGGNFGDLWPGHQALREAVIARNPQCRIVGMPQSIHFEDARGFDRFAKVAAGHPDLHLFWRDRTSYEVACARFPASNYLAPDMAHALWPKYRRPPATDDAPSLSLLRNDKETAGIPPDVKTAGRRLDWWDLHSGRWKTALRFCSGMVRRLGGTPLVLPVFDLWAAVGRSEANRLAGIFGRHREIVTSRLHGHIFACLTARRSRLFDNSYGKCSAYFDAWTGSLGIATLESRTVPQYQPGRWADPSISS